LPKVNGFTGSSLRRLLSNNDRVNPDKKKRRDGEASRHVFFYRAHRKDQKLFSKTSAQTVGHWWLKDMVMKTNQLQNSKIISASYGVKKLGPKEGRTIEVGGVRLTWKARGADTGYANSIYEMDLPPGKGIPTHSHPYAEVFYVIAGYTDFLRINEEGQEEWVQCGAGETVIAPANALHAFHNRSDKPTRFLSSSGYYHEVSLERYGQAVDINAPLSPDKEPTEAEAEQYLEVLKDAMGVQMYFPQSKAESGLAIFQELANRNT
jgi:quercetin dioxygenase-like cupin family protein